jgi:hypothetical protein
LVPCVGDCNADGTVTVNELVLALSLSLDGAASTACLAADRDRSGGVTVDEVLGGVQVALNGCGLAAFGDDL